MINALETKRHMQFLTLAPHFRGNQVIPVTRPSRSPDLKTIWHNVTAGCPVRKWYYVKPPFRRQVYSVEGHSWKTE